MGPGRLRRALATTLVFTTLASLPSCTSSSGCTPDPGDQSSVARVWDEVNLDAVRRDFPSPVVHARNLFHLSVAMWDAWAAFDPSAAGYLVEEDHEADDVAAAREEAISYAAYRVIAARYADTAGTEETLAQAASTMERLCLSADVVTTDGDSPAALGNRIAAQVLAYGLTDGSNEADDYVDETYEPVNPPLSPRVPGTDLSDPNRWQPLDLDQAIGQNGVPLEDGVQAFVGSQWGFVDSFALASDPEGVPIDPGDPPHLGDQATDAAYKASALEVLRFSSLLDPRGAPVIDIGPGAVGDNTPGTNDGDGYEVNPVTGEPYAPNLVNEGDFGRVVAEFWADGPASETPPGHWNTLANAASDQADALRVGGEGPAVDRLEWDVKLYLALNGALHDAAVAAWGAKRHYDYVRPISMIRYLAQNGQSTDPSLPSYSPRGLPLEPGLAEVATAASVRPGGRHEAAGAEPGEIVVRAWTGAPGEDGVAGVDWIRAVEWVTYQLSTFVTPSFAGYVSGHSAFSRAGAEILAAFTGSEFFPGGLGEWTVRAGDLEFEDGPTEDVTLQWARYADAADQAGLSRLYGGIHVRADDLHGRLMGRDVGRRAWTRAQEFYAGTAESVAAD